MTHFIKSIIKQIILFLFCCLGIPGPLFTENTLRFDIDKEWTFRNASKQEWFPASVPGCVHTDLLNNRLIPDPFYRNNEKAVQWIENEDWEYLTRFIVPGPLLQKQNIEISFEGLDTYARVSLNDTQILQTHNMFREWKADIKHLLKPGENTLRIYFRSPVKEVEQKWKQLGYELPGGARVMTRKAPYHYGWDWGPRLVTSGIWRPIKITAWDSARIESIRFVREKSDHDKAVISVVLDIRSTSPKEEDMEIQIKTAGQNTPPVISPIRLSRGLNRRQAAIRIDKPQLWWTHDLGTPHLYEFEICLKSKKEILDEKKERFGLRTLELIREKDEKGTGFYFKLNGVPLFMKGANYIPQDSFPNRVTPERSKSLINSAKEANMNMLRVWGGGIYENDDFYSFCDEAGILIWQDFMFACSMVPGDSDFLENVRQEAADNVKRLRNHPCIALWCGNNESAEGWANWGWQTPFSPQQRQQSGNDYDNVFLRILPEVVREYDDARPYWPSSPSFGRGNPRSLTEGDSHYWGVWHDEEPFSVLQQKIPRFMSEYGFQSFPPLKTIHYFTLPQDLDAESDVMKTHQKHPRGNRLIQTYMLRDYNLPTDFESFVYVSQLLQAEGIKLGIEAHRRAKPYCMGTLYWQLNDCWPVVSWSGMDYYGEWKALHYFAKKAYAPVLVSPVEENGRLKVYIVSDKLQPLQGVLKLSLTDFSGAVLWKSDVSCQIPADYPIKEGRKSESRPFFEIETSTLLEGKDKTRAVFTADLILAGEITASNLYYFTPPKELKLLDPRVRFEVKPVPVGYSITLSCETPAKNVFLSVDGVEGFFTDNFVDVLPGRPVTLFFKTYAKVADFEKKLKAAWLN